MELNYEKVRVSMIETINAIINELYDGKCEGVYIELGVNEMETYENHIIADCIVDGIIYDKDKNNIILKCHDVCWNENFEMPIETLDYYNITEILRVLI